MRWIVTDDIYGETWRRLLEFANVDLTLDEIIRRHGKPKAGQAQNYKKQANQARVCVLQAKEYFDAARGSTLFTSPNHAYYGAVALASLAMLVLGDGRKSLDVLRADSRNRHHGLFLTTGCNAKGATEGTHLVEKSFVEILGQGHFANWYATLPRRGTAYALVETRYGATKATSLKDVGHFDVPELPALVGKKLSIVDLLKYLPDLQSNLSRFGIRIASSRLTHEVTKENSGAETHKWTIHSCRSEKDRDLLLEKFMFSAALMDAVTYSMDEGVSAAIVKVRTNAKSQAGFSWPTTRDSMNHSPIGYADAPERHEITDLYLVAYQLSMLSRYYPDIWVSCIESHCRGAKLIEKAMEIIIKKLPILALSAMSAEDVVISTHREPWIN